jgi:hypothetical protein
MADFEAHVIALLTEIRDLLRVEKWGPTRPLRCSAGDLDLLKRLLPAIGGKFGSQVLPTREIIADPAIRELCCPLGAQEVGNLLSRAASDELNVDGLTVCRSATEHGATLWRVARRLPGLPEPLLSRTSFKVESSRRKTSA